MVTSRLKSVRNALTPWVFLALVGPPLLYRRRTAARRTLPTVFLIGATKSGSTSLAAYMTKHPAFVPALNKELMFLQDIPGFESKYERHRWARRLWGSYEQGLDSYRKFFPLRAEMEATGRRAGVTALTADTTPLYLYSRVAAQRVRDICPDARLVAVLREPVSRAYSDYNMFVDMTPYESRSFEQAVDDELDDACPNFELRYLNQGLYASHLEHWLKLFPREQLLVLDSRELFGEPQRAVARTFELLGLPPIEIQRFRVHNRGHYIAPMNEKTRQRLTEFFRPHNRRLFELLGEDFGWPS